MNVAVKSIAAVLLLVNLVTPVSRQGAGAAALSDDVITGRIQQVLRTNVQLRDEDILVTTAQGVVSLTGSVSSFSDRQRAEELCRRINGVEGVESQLAVQSTAESRSNTARVVERLVANDPVLREQRLTVEDRQGIVYLRGTVPNEYQNLHAERIVRMLLPGTGSIRSEIRVRSQSDDSLRTIALERLRSDRRIMALLVDVQVEQQIVRLNGYVESQRQKDLAESRIRSLPDVRDVENRLVVAYSPGDKLYR